MLQKKVQPWIYADQIRVGCGRLESCFCWFWSVNFVVQALGLQQGSSSETCCFPTGCSVCLGFVCLLILAKLFPQLSGKVTDVSHSLAGGSAVRGCPEVPGYLQEGHGDLRVLQAKGNPRDGQDGPRDWSHRWNVLITICQCNQVKILPLLFCLFHSTSFSKTKLWCQSCRLWYSGHLWHKLPTLCLNM